MIEIEEYNFQPYYMVLEGTKVIIASKTPDRKEYQQVRIDEFSAIVNNQELRNCFVEINLGQVFDLAYVDPEPND